MRVGVRGLCELQTGAAEDVQPVAKGLPTPLHFLIFPQHHKRWLEDREWGSTKVQMMYISKWKPGCLPALPPLYLAFLLFFHNGFWTSFWSICSFVGSGVHVHLFFFPFFKLCLSVLSHRQTGLPLWNSNRILMTNKQISCSVCFLLSTTKMFLWMHGHAALPGDQIKTVTGWHGLWIPYLHKI